MEMLLEKLRGPVNPKADMAKRRLKHGTVIYAIETRCSKDEAEELFCTYLKPLHEQLKGNEDYTGCNIITFIDPMFENGTIPRQIGIMFNNCDWDSLPDDLEFNHGHYCLCVKSITPNRRKR